MKAFPGRDVLSVGNFRASGGLSDGTLWLGVSRMLSLWEGLYLRLEYHIHVHGARNDILQYTLTSLVCLSELLSV